MPACTVLIGVSDTDGTDALMLLVLDLGAQPGAPAH